MSVRKNLTEFVMLKEITIENFKSFAEPVTFSLEADEGKVSEYPEHVIEKCDNKLLKISSFYGPNGGGKSNLLKAIEFVGRVGLSSFVDYTQLVSEEVPFEPCKMTSNDVISITSFFASDSYEIGYSFKTKMVNDPSGIMPMDKFLYTRKFLVPAIVEEGIVYRKKGESDFHELLSRDEAGKLQGDAFSVLNISAPGFALSPSVSAISYMMKTFYNVQNANSSYGLDILRDLWMNLYGIETMNSYVPSLIMESMVQELTPYTQQLVQELNDCGIIISDLHFVKNKESFYDVFLERKNASGDSFQINLDNESSGTRKTFSLLASLLTNSGKSKIYLADDLDAYLHPKLTRYLISYFTSEKNVNNQLIFNSHDIINMTNELFRRDEIWFAFKDESFATRLVPLSSIVDYKGEPVRKDAKFSKQYMEGRYGADPFIKKASSWYHD